MARQRPPSLFIDPPLVNSANPWATTLEDLTALYNCPHTGAVTTRTSLLQPFDHDPARHQFTLFNTANHQSEQDRTRSTGAENASLNTLGYSPLSLETYLGFIQDIATTSPAVRADKGFIVSVTGSPADVAACYKLIAAAQLTLPFPLAMEINLSCPNIPGKPPPAYNTDALLEYLMALQADGIDEHLPRIPCGLKTPPYTQAGDYDGLLGALQASTPKNGVCPISFITATNTLGSCLVLSDAETGESALPGFGTGGMAGAPLHPLALGNVKIIRMRLDRDEVKDALGHIQIIGVGGVLDASGYKRMKAVGAAFVGVGTGLGISGLGIFESIANGF
ncbi:hypothetical protein BD289DRAFT_82103 [Coniella lustricola]|uniref:Dihydroorotate dehydrogenase (fumarate) n=1 Tax=Coniella lustricola TaxID=2025994 RepID=A0A2T3AHA2_9PEZI|nr:hypothetical protein BD289DRAFT_82103 [Coniella lustricola]